MLRTWQWLLLACMCLVVMSQIAPHQMPALVWNLSKVTLGVWLGYWADRNLFPYARPGGPQIEGSRGLMMLRRALIVSAVVIALGLGV